MKLLLGGLLVVAALALLGFGLLDTRLPLPPFMDKRRFQVQVEYWGHRWSTACFSGALICAIAAVVTLTSGL